MSKKQKKRKKKRQLEKKNPISEKKSVILVGTPELQCLCIRTELSSHQYDSTDAERKRF